MKFRSIASVLSAFTLAFASMVTSCGNEGTIGSSIVDDSVEIVVLDTFKVSGQTVAVKAIPSRTLLHLLGRIDVSGYGYLESDFVTQFMPSLTLDTTGVKINDIDSIKLMMQVYKGNFIGDSIAPLGIDVYRLTKDLPSPIYSDTPLEDVYDPQPIGSVIYNASTLGMSDSLRTAKYHTLTVKLPQSLAQEIYAAYKENPANFADPTSFTNNVFKGLYVKNSYGSGRLTLVSNTLMRIYYKRHIKTAEGKDSILFAMGNYLAVTPEVVTNNNIVYDNAGSEVQKLIDAGEPIIVSPVGSDVQFEFPIRSIIDAFRAKSNSESVINSLTYTLPVDSVKNEFRVGPAPSLLMVQKSQKEKFFNNNSLPDNKTSFYADYDATNHCYSFNNLRAYLIEMLDKDTKQEMTEEDYTFVLVPVYVTKESNGSYYYQSESVTNVTPYINTPTMTKVKFDEAKIKFTFSTRANNYLDD